MPLSDSSFFKAVAIFAVFSIGAYFLFSQFTVFSHAQAGSQKITGTVVLLDDSKGEATSSRDPYLHRVVAPVSLPGDPAAGNCTIKATGCCGQDSANWGTGYAVYTTNRSLTVSSLPVVSENIHNLKNSCYTVNGSLVAGIYTVDLSCGDTVYCNPACTSPPPTCNPQYPASAGVVDAGCGATARGYGGTVDYLALSYSCPV